MINLIRDVFVVVVVVVVAFNPHFFLSAFAVRRHPVCVLQTPLALCRGPLESPGNFSGRMPIIEIISKSKRASLTNQCICFVNA